MPTGYLVTLGDGSLDAGDVISGAAIVFTADSGYPTGLGGGQWTWTGSDGGLPYADELEPGQYWLADNGNVYFVPDFGPVNTLSTATVSSAPAYSDSNVVDGTDGGELMDVGYTDGDGDQISNSDDVIYGNAGSDTISGGGGNDTIDGGDGSDSVEGGTGNDNIVGDRVGPAQSLNETMQYSYAQDDDGDRAAHFGDEGTGHEDDPLLLIDGDLGTEVKYHEGDIVEYAFGQTVAAGTWITLTEGSGSEDGNIDVYVSFGTTDANGDTLSGGGGGLGYENAVTNGQSVLIYSGPSNATVNLEIPMEATHIQFVSQDTHSGWSEIEFTELLTPLAPGDDTISGGDGADTIDGGLGDDSLDGGADDDSILGGEGNDTIFGQGGADTIFGGEGNDDIEGGSENDSVDGGLGDDAIRGDGGNDTIYGGDAGTNAPLERVAFKWSDIPDPDNDGQIDDGDGLDDGTQTVSGVTVTHSYSSSNVSYGTESTYTGGIDAGSDTVNANSVASLDGNSTTTLSFSKPVENVEFNVNDFENSLEFLTIRAYDADNNLITFDVTQGSAVSGSNTDAAAGNDRFFGTAGGNSDTSATGSVQISIPGPVSRVELDYDDNGGTLTVTDVWFDDPDTGVDMSGDDTIDAGSGDDVILAGVGNDVIAGGIGTDTYDASVSSDLADETITVTVDANGDGTAVKSVDGSTDTFTSIESFYAGEDENEADEFTVAAPVSRDDVSGIDNSAVGFFTSDDTGLSYFFGGVGEPTINDILTRNFDPGGGALRPQGTYNIASGEENGAQIGTFYFEGFEKVNFDVICFARHTMIETERGEVAVEDLVAGDMVLTLDSGYQPIRWIGSTTVAAIGKNAPIVVTEGTLGNTRDLWVSPQHRVLLEGWRQEMLFGELQVLAPAKALCNGSTIRQVQGGLVEYFHMMFDRHEIVYAQGALSESFHPGEVGMDSVSQDCFDEILMAFPELHSNLMAYGPSARVSLKPFEAEMLADDFLPSDIHLQHTLAA